MGHHAAVTYDTRALSASVPQTCIFSKSSLWQLRQLPTVALSVVLDLKLPLPASVATDVSSESLSCYVRMSQCFEAVGGLATWQHRAWHREEPSTWDSPGWGLASAGELRWPLGVVTFLQHLGEFHLRPSFWDVCDGRRGGRLETEPF